MKILLYSTANGEQEYIVPVDEVTVEVIDENKRPGFTLDGAFEITPCNPFRGCVGELRLGAEYRREG